MSNRAINAVLDYSQSKGSTRMFMLVIADGINKDNGTYRALIATLMRECNCSERTVQRLIHQALETGELVVLDNIGHASHFAIPLLPGEPGYEPQECHSETHTCKRYHTPLEITRESVRNADDYRLRPRQGGAKNDTLSSTQRGAKNDTPHLKPRKGVTELAPPGDRIGTPGCQDWHPRVTELAPSTLSRTRSLNPSDVPRPQTQSASQKPETSKPVPKPLTATQWARSPEGQAYLRKQGVSDRDIQKAGSTVFALFDMWRKIAGRV